MILMGNPPMGYLEGLRPLRKRLSFTAQSLPVLWDTGGALLLLNSMQLVGAIANPTPPPPQPIGEFIALSKSHHLPHA